MGIKQDVFRQQHLHFKALPFSAPHNRHPNPQFGNVNVGFKASALDSLIQRGSNESTAIGDANTRKQQLVQQE